MGILKSSALAKNFGYIPCFPRIVYKKIGSSSVTWFATKIIFPLLGIFSRPEISRFSVFVVIFLAALSKIFRIILEGWFFFCGLVTPVVVGSIIV